MVLNASVMVSSCSHCLEYVHRGRAWVGLHLVHDWGRNWEDNYLGVGFPSLSLVFFSYSLCLRAFSLLILDQGRAGAEYGTLVGFRLVVGLLQSWSWRLGGRGLLCCLLEC